MTWLLPSVPQVRTERPRLRQGHLTPDPPFFLQDLIWFHNLFLTLLFLVLVFVLETDNQLFIWPFSFRFCGSNKAPFGKVQSRLALPQEDSLLWSLFTLYTLVWPQWSAGVGAGDWSWEALQQAGRSLRNSRRGPSGSPCPTTLPERSSKWVSARCPALC